MARLVYTPVQQKEYDEWVASRPLVVQAIIAKCPPYLEYTLLGQLAHILAYNEGGTIRVQVEDPLFPREVFGVSPENLIPLEDKP